MGPQMAEQPHYPHAHALSPVKTKHPGAQGPVSMGSHRALLSHPPSFWEPSSPTATLLPPLVTHPAENKAPLASRSPLAPSVEGFGPSASVWFGGQALELG